MRKKEFKPEIEQMMTKGIVDGEYAQAQRNKQQENEDFKNYVSLMDSVREPKQYSWMSDIRLPEFVTYLLTQASIDATQYFSTRDFVEVYLEDSGDEAKNNAVAAKELINRTLNQKHIHHFQKYIRAKILVYLSGNVYARCWWEQSLKKEVVGYSTKYEPSVDETGKPITKVLKEEVYNFTPVVDRFNYDIIDPRNIFTDNKYVYSLQDKNWIIIRSERDINQLYADADTMGYVNLDGIEDVQGNESQASKDTFNPQQVSTQQTYKKEQGTLYKDFDVLERWGRYWVMVKNRDVNGDPIEVEPGIDELGHPKDNAEFLETVITFIVRNNFKRCIRFQVNPYKDSNGLSYRPIIRGLCYIHPVYDGGFGDGKNMREVQLAIDDTFNVTMDRTMLATLPVLKVKKYEAEDNPDIYIEPGHHIPLDNPNEDLSELTIKDNIQGGLSQIQLLQKAGQAAMAIFSTTEGDLPKLASTTATAIAGSEQRTNTRLNYKALSFENTFLLELYWMIQNMTHQFAQPETGTKLIGEKVQFFNPSKDYYYKPVTSAIELEYSKQSKVKQWTTILGYISQVQHPDAVKMVNYIMTNIVDLMGEEYSNFKKFLLNPQTPIQQGGGSQPGAAPPPSNQAGIPQSGMEQGARAAMSEAPQA